MYHPKALSDRYLLGVLQSERFASAMLTCLREEEIIDYQRNRISQLIDKILSHRLDPNKIPPFEKEDLNHTIYQLANALPVDLIKKGTKLLLLQVSEAQNTKISSQSFKENGCYISSNFSMTIHESRG